MNSEKLGEVTHCWLVTTVTALCSVNVTFIPSWVTSSCFSHLLSLHPSSSFLSLSSLPLPFLSPCPLFFPSNVHSLSLSPTISFSQAVCSDNFITLIRSQRSKNKFKELLAGLMHNRGDVDATAENGMTALHFAVLVSKVACL